MMLLEDLKRELLAADERLEREHVMSCATDARDADRTTGRLRQRWRHLGHRGRVMSVFAGGLVFAAAATGSAQVAGLDPWGRLVGQGRIDPELRATAEPGRSVGLRVADAPGRPGWELRAYVTRSGRLCVVGAGRGGEGLYRCFTSDRAAAVLTGRPRSGPQLVSVTQTGAPSMHPTHLVAWGLTEWNAPPPRFVVPEGTSIRVQGVESPLRVDVDHSTAGLSRRGRAVLSTLPQQLTLRLTVAELTRTRPAFTGDMIAVASTAPTATGAPSPTTPALTTIEITSASTWSRAHRRPWGASDDGTLDRSSLPVRGPTAVQRATFPVLARPRRDGDAIPRSALTVDLRHARIAKNASRRARVTGEGSLGPVWLVPGALNHGITVPLIEGLLCVAGPRPISACTTSTPQGDLPEPAAVICAPGLPKGRSLVWAFVPAQAERARVTFDDGTKTTYPAADLLLLVRPRAAARAVKIEWSGPRGFARMSRVRFPRDANRAVCGRGQAPHYWDLRTDGETHR